MTNDSEEAVYRERTIRILTALAEVGLTLSKYGQKKWVKAWDPYGHFRSGKAPQPEAKDIFTALVAVLASGGISLTAMAMDDLGLQTWPAIAVNYSGKAIVEWADPESEEKVSAAVTAMVLAEYPDALDKPTIH